MRHLALLILIFTAFAVNAQNTANITLTASKQGPASATLILEDVRFHPNLGIGLADVKLDPLVTVNFAEKTTEKTVIQLSEPKIVRLQYNGTGVNKTWMLFLQPGDDLTATFGENQDVTFSGKNANYQTFLKNYFLENQYQYLPVFGYKPSQIDNKSVIQQSDSLKKVRMDAFEKFKAANPSSPAFDAYVNATTVTEPALTRRAIQEKIMRGNRSLKLDPAQRKELEDQTLAEFKILPDESLLSGAYRDELRNWALISSTRKFPLTSETRYEISPDALKDVYASSKEKLANYPKQKEYLLTYWLNYAATAIPSSETAKSLLEDYKTTLPQSPYIAYFDKLIQAKDALQPGSSIADVSLLNVDSTAVTTTSLQGKPAVMVFAFTPGQHEPGLKALEDKYGSKVNFVYVLAADGIPFGTWKTLAKDRPNTKHLFATEEAVATLKDKYAVDIRYPFLVVDGSGKVVNRWIPQEFPNNKTLDAELQKVAK